MPAVETCSLLCQGRATSLPAKKTLFVGKADGHLGARGLSDILAGSGLQGGQPTGRVGAETAAQSGGSAFVLGRRLLVRHRQLVTVFLADADRQ